MFVVDPNLVTTVSTFIRQAREERGLSQGELAKLIGTTRQSVNQYEKGHFLPQLPIMLRLAKKLGIELDQLKQVFG